MTLYFIPAGTATAEIQERKSRFIATVTGVTSREEALSLIQEIRDQNPGAAHVCWGCIIGSPASPVYTGCRDDGEPAGTAGKPILSVLQHNRIGNAVAVATRYFGGVKLGTGGLVRAYSASIRAAIEKICLKEFIPTRHVNISFPYRFENSIRHFLKTENISIISTIYKDDVALGLEIAVNIEEKFHDRVRNMTRGTIRFNRK